MEREEIKLEILKEMLSEEIKKNFALQNEPSNLLNDFQNIFWHFLNDETLEWKNRDYIARNYFLTFLQNCSTSPFSQDLKNTTLKIYEDAKKEMNRLNKSYNASSTQNS